MAAYGREHRVVVLLRRRQEDQSVAELPWPACRSVLPNVNDLRVRLRTVELYLIPVQDHEVGVVGTIGDLRVLPGAANLERRVLELSGEDVGGGLLGLPHPDLVLCIED